jgi:hypothetical protein
LFVEGDLMRRQIDNSILEMALVGYSAKRNEVVQKMADIQRQLGGRASASVTIQTAEPKLKHHINAAGRARIAEAQRRRWAASKSAESPAQPTPELSKPKRKLSKAGRAAIVAATKKRWALKRAEAAKVEQAATQKTSAKKTAARNTVKKALTKVAVQKAAPKKSTPAKRKRPVKTAVNNAAPVTAEPTAAAEVASTPEVVTQ